MPKSATHSRSWQNQQDDFVGIINVFDDEADQRRSSSYTDDPDEMLLDLLGDSSDPTINDATPSDVLSELSMSGNMPDPESDDDMLLNSHSVGLRLNEDYDNPQPLNMAADIDAAEKSRRGG